MDKKRLIHLVEDLKPGGLENVIADIACGLNREEFDVEVWAVVKGGEVAEELLKKGIKVHICNIAGYYNPFHILKLTCMLHKRKITIIHTHGYFASVIGRISALIARVPVIVTHLHTIYYDMAPRNRIIDRFLNAFSNKIICVSEAVKKSFVDAGFNMGKAIVIYNGRDQAKYIFHQDHQLETNTIITVASLHIHKGHTFLLKALHQVLEEFPETYLWLVGDGPLREQLKIEAEHLGITHHVSFLGYRKDMSELLSQATLLVLPSLREGFGLAIIEAYASGLSVVATKVGGIPEVVIDNETGFLVAPGDEKALAEAIIHLLRHPQQMKLMGAKARQIFVEKFETKEMIRKIEGVYREFL
jgi:glycosyltransferase involved in cell wall biosynthesis